MTIVRLNERQKVGITIQYTDLIHENRKVKRVRAQRSFEHRRSHRARKLMRLLCTFEVNKRSRVLCCTTYFRTVMLDLMAAGLE